MPFPPGGTSGPAVRVNGKFLSVGEERFLVKGVAYGTFAPDADGVQFPNRERVAQDFALMAAAGINTVRTYTVPPEWLFDEATRQGLRLMVGMPWAQHLAFLDDPALARQIRSDAVATVRRFGAHPAALLFAVGNEIPPAIVRWHGQGRIERFLRELSSDLKAAAPDSLLTYVNFPPTEYLELDTFDVCAFNVYLHREADLRAYLARLQHIAGDRPLLLAEAGGDSIREGLEGQARITAMHLRAAFSEGACGAVAFSWTDEWWRGGQTVDDWAFGLVDAERRPKPALRAVCEAFADAPFADAEPGPRVSVVVCAYNAADTLGDCLASLQRLTYPDVEVIVVNDGSRDSTGDIARRFPSVRLIEVPNGGLSAARNIGLAAATGAIVAYTDADTRVDPDWLTYLVQPMLRSDVVGSGGPNRVPADDPWVAQCVARAPGGPTHVLLDDRIAEHVPGCNMAFRREALLAIGGFNPVYLRAGDDVDVCWRLQARGWRIGFAPSALVWHHHRASVRAYWRQQVGYGEGETWLDAHHPEKFVGGHMLWRGRIYSPLPYVRSLSGSRVHTGIWGTAPFPSVYRTDCHPLEFLPHSPGWLVASTAFCLAGGIGFLTSELGAAWLLFLAGLAGWSTTIGRCAVFARRSDVSTLPPLLGSTRARSHARYRALIGWLHLIQPLARATGRLRGVWAPPPAVAPEHVTRAPWKAPVPSWRSTLSSGVLLAGGGTERTYWSESWFAQSAVLTELAGVLRASRPARIVHADDGWHVDRDLSIGVGRWGWLHVRALVEEHAQGRCLLRVATRLRPSAAGFAKALVLALSLVAVTSAAIALRWPQASVAVGAAVLAIFARAAWQTTRATAMVEQGLERVAATWRMQVLPDHPPARRRVRTRRSPVSVAQFGQAAVAALVAVSAVVGVVSLARDRAAERAQLATAIQASIAAVPRVPAAAGGVAIGPTGDVLVADGGRGLIRRLRLRLPVEPIRANRQMAATPQPVGASLAFDAAADIAVGPTGDLYVADAGNNRVCRIDRLTGKIVTVAGSGDVGFDGDGKQATQAALSQPGAVVVARNGDLYVADTRNNRVRVISQATGRISTIAGDGERGGVDVGDGGQARTAHLDRPAGLALAPDGDLFIADTGHNRVRRLDMATGVITTVAGDGRAVSAGNGGPAVAASLAAPTALAVQPVGRRVVLYVADQASGAIRVVGLDGRITTLGSPVRLVTPTRMAYHPDGWLFVKDASTTGVSIVPVARPSHLELAATRRRAGPRKAA